MLDEVELLVRGRRPEVGALVGLALAFSSPSSLTMVMVDFLPKGGLVSTMLNRVAGVERRLSSAATGLRPRVRRCRGGRGSSRRAARRRPRCSTPRRASSRRWLFWSRSSWSWFCDVVVGGEQEAAGAAGRVADASSPGRGLHAVHDGLDERAGREVLARAALHVLRRYAPSRPS